jgi:colanic acid biosynthesis glycosyl transferase WcaI
MKILIITPFYAPDLGPSAPLFTLLSEALVKHGHRISVVAAVPHYPTGRVFANFRTTLIKHSIENGVEVIRVPVPSLDRMNFKERLLQFVSFQIGSTIASLFYKYDIVLVTNPAIETWLPCIWHAVIRHKPMIYSVFDVYPDVGIKLGIFRNKTVIGAVRCLERSCLKLSAAVQIISDNFRSSLHALGVPEYKLDLIPIWVDSDFIRPLPQDNDFSQEFDLNGKFVVLYAGNIGLSQGLENVLTAAEMLGKFSDLSFVFVGDGSGKENLQNEAKKRKLTNVQFIPFQPRERLPEVLASANATIILLRHGIGIDSLPSKAYSAMASRRPIIASVDEESDISHLIKKAEAGICISSENPEKLAEAIIKLKNDTNLCEQLGSNGRKYIEQNHSVYKAEEQFELLFNKVITSMKTQKAEHIFS